MSTLIHAILTSVGWLLGGVVFVVAVFFALVVIGAVMEIYKRVKRHGR